jgi:5'-nucleotidase
VSASLRYRWSQAADGTAQLGEVLVDGRQLDAARDYRLVVNSFMAEGGDGQGVLRQGRDRISVGVDIDALAELLSENPAVVTQVEPGRIQRR